MCCVCMYLSVSRTNLCIFAIKGWNVETLIQLYETLETISALMAPKVSIQLNLGSIYFPESLSR